MRELSGCLADPEARNLKLRPRIRRVAFSVVVGWRLLVREAGSAAST